MKTLTIMLNSGGEITQKKIHTKESVSINDFPDQPIQFIGKIIAITKVNTEDMGLKISLKNGTYIEINCGNDSILFGRLCKMYDLDKEMKIIVE